ncbi:hypothetical protein PG994_002712 [Apiospora phragmitis]|uniref:Uncharacterized protein n=1 Tax=Apiospora phragmitis TaxID=2905665 RepID=A0ABR1W8S8_9PEZI
MTEPVAQAPIAKIQINVDINGLVGLNAYANVVAVNGLPDIATGQTSNALPVGHPVVLVNGAPLMVTVPVADFLASSIIFNGLDAIYIATEATIQEAVADVDLSWGRYQPNTSSSGAGSGTGAA